MELTWCFQFVSSVGINTHNADADTVLRVHQAPILSITYFPIFTKTQETRKWAQLVSGRQTGRAVRKGTLLDPRAVPSWGLRVLRADFLDSWILAKPLLCGPDSPCQTPCP